MSRRRFFLLLLLLLVVAASALGAVLLAGVDLKSFRQEMEGRLSTALSRPVHLGEAHFSLRHGPALTFTDLRLEPAAEDDWRLQAERLHMQLSPAALLRGRILFDRVLLEGALIRLLLAPASGVPASPLADFSGRFPEIRSLAVRNGTLLVEDRRHSGTSSLLALEEIEANLADLAPGRPGWISLGARLRQPTGTADLRLAGEFVPGADWRRTQVHFGLKLDGWMPASVLPLIAPAVEISGETALQLTLSGTPADGLRFAAEAAGEGVMLAFRGRPLNPLPLQNARLQGTWVAAPQENRLNDLAFALDDLSGNGSFAWRQTKEGLWLEADLTAPRLPLPQVLSWFPEHPAMDQFRKSLRNGFLEIRFARFVGPAASLHPVRGTLPLEAELAIDGLALAAGGQEFDETSFTANLRHGRLDVGEGNSRFMGQPIRFTGTIADPFAPHPHFSFQAQGELETGNLLRLVPEDQRQGLELAGPAPLRISGGGTRAASTIDLQADLTAVQIRRGATPFKKAGETCDLRLIGEILPDRLAMQEGRLRLPALELQATGHLDRDAEGSFRLDLDLTASDLATARPRLPLLEKLQARGHVAAKVQLTGKKGEIRQRSGTVRLKGAGMRLGGVIADLNRADGTLHFEGDRLAFDRLTARLGASPVVVKGSLNNFAAPELRLRVSAKAIRADELIFRSPTMFLRDLQGDLRLDREKLLFEKVGVRLDGGTRAVVRGSVEFRQPVVALEIEAEHGNIDEVIALWKGPKPRRKAGGGGDVKVRIAALAREGTLGPLRFQGATGLISYEEGYLSIFPLRFSTGGGQCSARVAVQLGEDPALLQVSGHLEEVDAAAAHYQLLQRQGLVTGKMEGDFYLEGRIGPQFLETSAGGFNLEIRKGVLRKFKSLARVFSLLNISQILTLQLPDMAREGMPFDRLSGTFSLREGVLATEDLFVDSNAMNLSVVGQIDLRTEEVDFVLGVKPLGTVDKIVTHIPLAGWILAGDEKALITAHFLVRGKAGEAEVLPVPITSISEKVVGIFRRVFHLPGRVIEEVGDLVRRPE